MTPDCRPFLPIAAAALLCAAPAAAHEAWLLTPEEVYKLSLAPVPALFFDRQALMLVALAAALAVFAALLLAERAQPAATRVLRPLHDASPDFGPLALRLGLGLTIGLNALGGLPRHGTARWSEPTLFVPDMQLSLAPGWEWLAPAALTAAALLLAGLAVRTAALGVIVLVLLGACAFPVDFLLYYAPHFAAPALLLLHYGGGRFGLDAKLSGSRQARNANANAVWTTAQVLSGAGFALIAVCVKFLQPTLLIAILDHGGLSFFGLPQPWTALFMMSIELLAGVLLAMGLLLRPVALFLIGAFTFFAIVLQESPLLHGNLYGLCVFLFLHGGRSPGVLRLRQPGAERA
ncbi:hypothetical protein [Cribrihabitans neustonicus]|uniref:hypothetical protein n=1 Tax=Cribrihabitans neustonicus TaxID=1429085 RepID=UPI003B5CB011